MPVRALQHNTGLPAKPPIHAAEELTGGGNQAWIEHCGQIYVLRITRAGKLILTK